MAFRLNINRLQIENGLLARILFKFTDYSQVIHIIIMVNLQCVMGSKFD